MTVRNTPAALLPAQPFSLDRVRAKGAAPAEASTRAPAVSAPADLYGAAGARPLPADAGSVGAVAAPRAGVVTSSEILQATHPSRAAELDIFGTPTGEQRKAILAQIQSASRLELTGVQGIPDDSLSQGIAAAAKRGAQVKVVLNPVAGGSPDALLTHYRGLGAEVSVGTGTPATAVRIAGQNGEPQALAWRNWPGTVDVQPGCIIETGTVEGVQEAVRGARAAGAGLKVVGSGHSWSGITGAADGDWVLKLSGMNKLHGIEKLPDGKALVTADGGMTLATLCEELDRNGLSIPNLGTTTFQTIAGVVATNTHGTGISKGGFSTIVESVEFIDGKGDKRVASRDSDPEVFNAVRTGLGLTGVVTKLTLKVDEAYNIAVNTYTEPLAHVVQPGVIEDLAAKHEWFQFFLFPYSGKAWVMTGDKTDAPATGKSNTAMERITLRYVEPAVRALGTRVPRLIPYVMKIAGSNAPTRSFVDRPHKALPFEADAEGNHGISTVEYFFPVEHTAEIVEELNNLLDKGAKKGEFHSQFYLLVRFQAGDDTFMSPVQTDDPNAKFTAITVPYLASCCATGDFYGAMRTAIDTVLEKNGSPPARLHWGKMHDGFDANDLAERTPQLDRFLEVRSELDPDGVFLNPWAQEWLGVERPEKAQEPRR